MKKKIFVVSLSAMLILSSCGNSVEPATASKEPTEETITESTMDDATINTSTVETITETDAMVDIIIGAPIFDETTSINDYINQLSVDDPDGKYSVYDDSHYISTITESERQEMLKIMESADFIPSAFEQLFTDEQYGGAFINVECDDEFQEFSVYVAKEKYQENEFTCSLTATILISMLSDSCQAYKLIAPEDRVVKIKIIDNETKEIIFQQ